MTLTRFVPTPESRSAQVAVQDLVARVGSGRSQQPATPLYLHGPTGTGKTLIVNCLIEEVVRRAPQLVVCVLKAADFEALVHEPQEDSQENSAQLDTARQSDLLIIEDLQHLCPKDEARRRRVAEAFVHLFDERLGRRQQMVFTAAVGPGELVELPGRLVSRLGNGLVVGLRPLQESSRLEVLVEKAQERQLAVSREILSWLAKHLVGSGRQLEGALTQLELLSRVHHGPLDVRSIAVHFKEQGRAGKPTVDRIARRVSNYFRVDPKHLLSRRRHQNVLLPRQVSMYLTRKLTGLSLEGIGDYFGGRDHSTVVHACRKIEDALSTDPALASAVQQLQADLS